MREVRLANEDDISVCETEEEALGMLQSASVSKVALCANSFDLRPEMAIGGYRIKQVFFDSSALAAIYRK